MQSHLKSLKSADDFINHLKLSSHPQGCGYFLETDRNPLKVNLEKANSGNEMQERNLSTCIIALFKGGQINPLHRTRSTQIIHFYPSGNSNLLVHLIGEDGKLMTCRMPDVFQLKIPALTWFAFEVESKNESSFVITGHTVTPGFDINDFELANKQALSFQYPKLAKFIDKYTVADKPACLLNSSSQAKVDSNKNKSFIKMKL